MAATSGWTALAIRRSCPGWRSLLAVTWASRLRAFCSAEPPAASIPAIMSSVVTVSQRSSAARSSSSREEKCQ
ncbi:MAG: hypothetical protein ACRDPF_15120 [Streptosporangiaceae bacterium]